MARPADQARARRPFPWLRVALVALVTALALALLVLLFPWDVLRAPLNRYVSDKTGRHFEITRKLDVKLGLATRVLADGIVFANPDWAKERNLVEAEAAEIELRLWPLLRGRLELQRVALRKPKLGLEELADGRRTWTLDRQGKDTGALKVDTLDVDQGTLRYISESQQADVRADFQIDDHAARRAAGERMPLSFRARGQWRGAPFTAEGKTGSVLALRQAVDEPFPLEVSAVNGATRLQASGTVRSLVGLGGADLQVRLRGRNLADLYAILDLVLPATPPFDVAAQLRHEGGRWQAAKIEGRIGRTDIAGNLALDRSRPVALLQGDIASRNLDFNDLAPLVGLGPTRPTSPAAVAAAANGAKRAAPAGRVFSDTPIDLKRLQSMNADVRVNAARVVNAPKVPLERIATRVRLSDGVLLLDPLELGVAAGKLAGMVRLDSRSQPSQARIDLKAQGLQLAKLFPAVDLTRASVGQVHGQLTLAGQGRSVAEMLAHSAGDVSLLLGRGRISNLLLELAGLDGGEIVKFLAGRDQRVELRCAAAAFSVQGGLMTTRALVLDTSDTVVWGDGGINLANEKVDLVFRPYPKDMSILTMRSPLTLKGALGKLEAGIDKRSFATRAGITIALTAINPLLGLASTVETGPGQDADCTAVLKEAAAKPPVAAPAGAAPGNAKAPAVPTRAPAAAPARP
ncbi:MAG TPA: AsmA family protein [Ramlibacter sp.]|nr:AsmA family protein [Ramlibacter sp.]